MSRTIRGAGDESGFTLIELLVVVIVIGILAAIAIPVYLGAQTSARDSGVKSDLGSAKTAVVAYFTDKGESATTPTFDSNGSTGLAKYGYAKSASTTSIAFKTGSTPKSTSFCIEGVGVTTNKFHATESSGSLDGGC